MPYFSNLGKREFEKEILTVQDINAYFDEKQALDGFENAQSEKKAFLLQVLAFDWDADKFNDDILFGRVDWNPDDNPVLTEATGRYYGLASNYTAEMGQLAMMGDMVDMPVSGSVYPNLLNDVLDKLTPQQIWEKRDLLRKALLGDRMISVDFEGQQLQDELKAVQNARQELGLMLGSVNVEMNPNANPGPQQVVQQRKQRQRRFVVEDNNGNYDIARLQLANGEEPADLLREFARRSTPPEEKRNLLLTYLYHDATDEQFAIAARKVQNNEAVRKMVDDLIEYGDIVYLSGEGQVKDFKNAIDTGAVDFVNAQIDLMHQAQIKGEEELNDIQNIVNLEERKKKEEQEDEIEYDEDEYENPEDEKEELKEKRSDDLLQDKIDEDVEFIYEEPKDQAQKVKAPEIIIKVDPKDKELSRDQLLTNLKSDQIPVEEKRGQLVAYMFRDLNEKAFDKQVKELENSKPLKELVADLVKKAGENGFDAFFNTQFESMLQNTLLQNTESRVEGPRVYNRLRKFEKDVAIQKEEAARKLQEEQERQRIGEEAQKALADAEGKSMTDLVNLVIGYKGAHENIPSSNEYAIQSREADAYVQRLLQDQNKADAFYKAVAQKKVDFYLEYDADMRKEQSEIQKGTGQRERYKDFQQHTDLVPMIAAQIVLNAKPRREQNGKGLDLLEKMLPNKEKLKTEESGYLHQKNENDLTKDYEKSYQNGLTIRQKARASYERLGFVKISNDQFPQGTDRTKEVLAARQVRGALTKYDEALAKFNTSRLSIFRQESGTHARLRLAAKKMVDLRKELGVSKKVEDFLPRITDPAEKKEIAKKWLAATEDMHYYADHYVTVKNPKTIAGIDRHNGAKDLQTIAKKESEWIDKAILDNGGNDFSLSSLHKEIAEDKVREAEQALSKMDYSKPTEKKDGKSISAQEEAQQKYVADKLYDVLAGVVAARELSKNPASTTTFHQCRKKLDRSIWMAEAIKNYMEDKNNWKKETIMNDLKDGAKGLFAKMKTAYQVNVEQIAKPEEPVKRSAQPKI